MPDTLKKGGAKKALIVGITYERSTNLKQNGFLPQLGAHKDTIKLKALLMSMFAC